MVGTRRHALLRELLENRDGLTADDLAAQLKVTRAAVHQHLVALQRDGFVARRDFAKTRGRPGHIFAITDEGIHQFPKRYDWFSELLLSVLSERLNDEELREELARLGQRIGCKLKSEGEELDRRERLAAIINAMNDLGYIARLSRDSDAPEEIEAFNCVYHHLAAEHPQICEFDLSLLEAAAGSRPEHTECMVRGGNSCRFKFSRK